MRDSSWDNTGVARQGSRRPWLKWALIGIGVVFGLPILMTATIGSLALRHRAQVWPAVRAIHARLQTDEGARDLFVKNPALANSYASDQDFLDTVRTWRTRVGDLPVQEPREGPSYSPDSDPGEAAASIQGLGGAWMLVNIRGGAFAGPIQGEGIDRIFFGEDKKALRTARKNANAIKKLREWDNFRNLMLQCGDDSNATGALPSRTRLALALPKRNHLSGIHESLASSLSEPPRQTTGRSPRIQHPHLSISLQALSNHDLQGRRWAGTGGHVDGRPTRQSGTAAIKPS